MRMFPARIGGDRIIYYNNETGPAGGPASRSARIRHCANNNNIIRFIFFYHNIRTDHIVTVCGVDFYSGENSYNITYTTREVYRKRGGLVNAVPRARAVPIVVVAVVCTYYYNNTIIILNYNRRNT